MVREGRVDRSRKKLFQKLRMQLLLFSLLLLSSLFLFLLSFSFVTVIFGASRASKNLLDVDKEFHYSFKVCHFEVAGGVSGHLASMLLISQDPNAYFYGNSLRGLFSYKGIMQENCKKKESITVIFNKITIAK